MVISAERIITLNRIQVNFTNVFTVLILPTILNSSNLFTCAFRFFPIELIIMGTIFTLIFQSFRNSCKMSWHLLLLYKLKLTKNVLCILFEKVFSFFSLDHNVSLGALFRFPHRNFVIEVITNKTRENKNASPREIIFNDFIYYSCYNVIFIFYFLFISLQGCPIFPDNKERLYSLKIAECVSCIWLHNYV